MQRLFYLLSLLKSQYLDKKSQERSSFKNLKRIIYYSYKYNPFYRKKWKRANFNPDKFKNLEDIKKIPITSKEEVIKNIHEIMSPSVLSVFNTYKNKIFDSFEVKINQYFFKRTSGSSGIILVLPIKNNVKKFLDVIYVRNLMLTGYTPNEKIILTTPKRTKYLNFYGLRILYLDIFLPLEKQIEILEKETNFTLVSYPTFLFYIAQKRNRIRPNRIITTAETLSESMRKKLEDYFGCEVFNMYGAAESGIIAGECKEKTGLHENIESTYIETIKNNEEVREEPGEIIITPLRNFDLPLIRYKLGDIGILSNETCSCRRSLPLLKKILGRANDFIVLRNHKLISPVLIDNLLAGTRGIRLFRVIQRNLNECLVIYEGKKTAKNEIKENMKKITYNQIRIIVKRVKKLERQGHKHQTVISKLPFKGDENEIIY